MKTVLITGVSTGIGYATAEALLARGYTVFGSVRKAADAERLHMEFGEDFFPLQFDVTDHAAMKTAVARVKKTVGDRGLTALINNAGISTTGPLMHMPLDEFRYQFEVNLFGLLDVTQQCLPLLGARPDAPHPPGRIVNVSSVSGQIAYPFMGAYAASKHALEGMSDALRRELMLYGIEVILIEPGTTQTPIIDKAGEGVEKYAGTDYGRIITTMQEEAIGERRQTAIPVARVAKVIADALEASPPKTRYPVPRKWLTGWLAPRLLPDRWLDRLVASKLGIKRNA